jgi:glucose/mannose-6-phosphate isomerase
MNNLDTCNLRQVIIGYPNQLKVGQEFAKNTKVPKKDFSNLIICGMGGSALPADLLVNFFQNNGGSPLPIYVCRDYNLPANASSNSLVFISSYSGNTEETVSCLEKAREIQANIVVFTAGGKLEELAKKYQLSLVKYEIDYKNFQPRYAVTYAFMAMHQTLTNLELTDTIDKLPDVEPLSFEEKGKKIAQKIKGKTPIIYASNRLKTIAKNWKIKINENAKTPAFWNYFPELNHNEMVGFTNPQGNFISLMLIDENDSEKIKKRAKITAQLYKEKGLNIEIINLGGESYLEKILRALVLGDWVSYYLALEYNQDPTPVDMVENFKGRIEK